MDNSGQRVDHPRRRWTRGASLAALTLLVALGSAAAIGHLRAKADTARRGQTELTELHKDAAAQSALEWQITATLTAEPEILDRLADLRQDIVNCLHEPDLEVAGRETVDTIRERFATYNMAVDAEISATIRGNRAAARAIDESRVDPSYAALEASLQEAIADLDTKATTSSRNATLGTYGIMFAAALIIAALASLFRRQRVETAELRRAATTDGLTGLLNHRGFREALDDMAAAADADGGALSVVIMDLDHFKLVNDTHGHERGDRVLREVGDRLRSVARDGELIGRLGGEEFAWILPGADGAAAWQAAERARNAIRQGPLGGLDVTVSAGVCDLATGGGVATMLRFADGALYWAKEQGRDVAVLYSPQVVTELSPADRADRLMHAQSLGALRALARVVDANDPDTHRHSERVAEWSVAIAHRLGWDGDAIVRLRDAALLHDIGKIAIPETILRKPAPLTDAERAEVRRHPALGAQIVSEVLNPDQVAWVRGHHERVDGAGYPDGLALAEISEGARIIAVADAWDAMTTHRPYRDAFTPHEALNELRAGAGAQWWPDGVDALEAVLLSGDRRSDVPVAAAR